MQPHLLSLSNINKGAGKNGGLRYTFHVACDTEYFLSGNGLVHALWMDGKG
ncbi:hypothetical protein [Paenibacillus sp. FSL M7-1046]|uniref:hypothetical protein n=1 Tax=Paenibacillus sp. FSL M7-1046 TaxID=2975315 RepID=UPI0030FC5AF8